MSKPSLRAEWLSLHYWEGLLATDRLSDEDRLTFETAFSDYLTLFPVLDTSTQRIQSVHKAVSTLHDGNLIVLFLSLLDIYLTSDDAPTRNLDLFVELYEPLLSVSSLSSVDVSYIDAMKFRLEAVKNNRPGTQALDFSFLLRDGAYTSLHKIKAERLLLIFFDFECRDCIRFLESLRASSILEEMISKDKLQLIAVYRDGDTAIWEARKRSLPASWIVVLEDGAVDKGHLYDLPSMPRAFLLDSDHRVLLRNASLDEIMRALAQF